MHPKKYTPSWVLKTIPTRKEQQHIEVGNKKWYTSTCGYSKQYPPYEDRINLPKNIRNGTPLLWVLKRIPIFEKTNTRLHMTNTNRSIVPDEENPIGAIFTQFPELNGRQIARAMNINETLFQNYINGRKRPSFERLQDIENYLHTLGEALSRVRF